jgi:uncharacterized protein (TIGR02001 family)
MKKLALALGLSTLIAPMSHALELNQELSLDLTVTALSDYRPRGISYTQNDPALQFDAMLSSKSTGLYIGAWASTVDYGYGSKVRYEMDYYAGWYLPLSEKVGLDLGYIKYTYPNGSGDNSSEVYAMLSAYGFTLAAQYSDDVPALGDEHSYLYSWLGYKTQLPYDVGLSARFGQVDYKDPWLVSASGHRREAYREWEVKVSKQVIGLKWSLAYADTDLSRQECMNLNGFDDICSATAVVGVSKSF